MNTHHAICLFHLSAWFCSQNKSVIPDLLRVGCLGARITTQNSIFNGGRGRDTIAASHFIVWILIYFSSPHVHSPKEIKNPLKTFHKAQPVPVDRIRSTPTFEKVAWKIFLMPLILCFFFKIFILNIRGGNPVICFESAPKLQNLPLYVVQYPSQKEWNIF